MASEDEGYLESGSGGTELERSQQNEIRRLRAELEIAREEVISQNVGLMRALKSLPPISERAGLWKWALGDEYESTRQQAANSRAAHSHVEIPPSESFPWGSLTSLSLSPPPLSSSSSPISSSSSSGSDTWAASQPYAMGASSSNNRNTLRNRDRYIRRSEGGNEI